MEALLQQLNRAGVRYLCIGGQAMRLAGMPRFSMDWDLFIPGRDLENLQRLNQALADELDAPVDPLGPLGQGFVQTYQTRYGVVQFHLDVPGLPSFDEAARRSVIRTTEHGFGVPCVADEDLLAAKRAAGRPQDGPDIEFLVAKLAAARKD